MKLFISHGLTNRNVQTNLAEWLIRRNHSNERGGNRWLTNDPDGVVLRIRLNFIWCEVSSRRYSSKEELGVGVVGGRVVGAYRRD